MSTQTNLPEFQEMALEFLGVSFSYPTTWVTNTELLQAGVLLLAPPDVFSGPQGSPNPLVGPVINVVAQQVDERVGLDDFVKVELARLQQSTGTSPKVEYKTTVAGNPGTKALAVVTEQGIAIQFLIQWTVANNVAYSISMTVPKNLASASQPIVKKIFASFKLSPPQPKSSLFESLVTANFFLRYPKDWKLTAGSQGPKVATINGLDPNHKSEVTVVEIPSNGRTLEEHLTVVQGGLEKQLVKTLEVTNLKLGTVPAKILSWTLDSDVPQHFVQLITVDPTEPSIILSVTCSTFASKEEITENVFHIILRTLRFRSDKESYVEGTEHWTAFVHFSLRMGFCFSDAFSVAPESARITELMLVPTEELHSEAPNTTLTLLLKDCRKNPKNMLTNADQTSNIIQGLQQIFAPGSFRAEPPYKSFMGGYEAEVVITSGTSMSMDGQMEEDRMFFYKHSTATDRMASVLFCLGTTAEESKYWSVCEKFADTTFWC